MRGYDRTIGVREGKRPQREFAEVWQQPKGMEATSEGGLLRIQAELPFGCHLARLAKIVNEIMKAVRNRGGVRPACHRTQTDVRQQHIWQVHEALLVGDGAEEKTGNALLLGIRAECRTCLACRSSRSRAVGSRFSTGHVPVGPAGSIWGV